MQSNHSNLHQPHSVWLCFDTRDARDCTAEIERLSRVTSTPVFTPHVTLLGDLFGAPRETMQVCRAFASGLQLLDLEIKGLVRGETFFMSHFLDLRVPDEICHLRDALAKALSISTPGVFRPHLSLAYGATAALPEPPGRLLLNGQGGPRCLRVSSLVVAASSSGVPIERWTVLYEMLMGK
ncbi:MAG: 2'-5' RNA ligase family protein [Pseudomonadota bacterium]